MEQVKRIRRTSAEIKILLEQYSQSKLSAKAFCKLHQLSEASYYKWRSRFLTASTTPKNNFVILQKSSTVQTDPVLFAEVNGIRMYQPVAASYLKELIA